MVTSIRSEFMNAFNLQTPSSPNGHRLATNDIMLKGMQNPVIKRLTRDRLPISRFILVHILSFLYKTTSITVFPYNEQNMVATRITKAVFCSTVE